MRKPCREVYTRFHSVRLHIWKPRASCKASARTADSYSTDIQTSSGGFICSEKNKKGWKSFSRSVKPWGSTVGGGAAAEQQRRHRQWAAPVITCHNEQSRGRQPCVLVGDGFLKCVMALDLDASSSGFSCLIYRGCNEKQTKHDNHRAYADS